MNLMNIASVNFTVRGEIVKLLEKLDWKYRSFLTEGGGVPDSVDSTIDVRFVEGGMPDMKSAHQLFDGGGPWSMYQDGNDLYIVFWPPSFEEPLWTAKMQKDFSSLSVYCGRKLFKMHHGQLKLSNPLCYPLDQIVLMHHLASRKGILIHAAGIELNGKGYVFPGKSGAGKSTISRQFSGKSHFKLLSDDRMIIRKKGEEFIAYGTPWPGEAGVVLNKSIPLGGIFFINHGKENRIKKIRHREAVERFLPVTSIPWYDRETMPMILSFIDNLTSCVPSHLLDFKPNKEAADVLEQFLAI